MRYHLFSPLDLPLPGYVVPMARVYLPDCSQDQVHEPGAGTGAGTYFEGGRWVRGWLHTQPDYEAQRDKYEARIVCDWLRRAGAVLGSGRARPLLFVRGWGQPYSRPLDGARTRESPGLWQHPADAVGGLTGWASLYARSGIPYWAQRGRDLTLAIRHEAEAQGLMLPRGVVIDMETAPSHRQGLKLSGATQIGSWPDHVRDSRWASATVIPYRTLLSLGRRSLAEMSARNEIPAVNLAQAWHHADNLAFSRWWAGTVRAITSDLLDRAIYRSATTHFEADAATDDAGDQVVTSQYDHTLGSGSPRLWETTGEKTIGGWVQSYCQETHQGPVLYNFNLESKAPGESDAAYVARATAEQLAACSPDKPLLPWLMAVGEPWAGTAPQSFTQTADALTDQLSQLAARGVEDAIIYWDHIAGVADLPATLAVLAAHEGV